MSSDEYQPPSRRHRRARRRAAARDRRRPGSCSTAATGCAPPASSALRDVPVRVVAPADPVGYMSALGVAAPPPQRLAEGCARARTRQLFQTGARAGGPASAREPETARRGGNVATSGRTHPRTAPPRSPALRTDDARRDHRPRRRPGPVRAIKAASSSRAHSAPPGRTRSNATPQIGSRARAAARPFELIYADPPWQLGNPDSDYAPEQHYPTLPLDQIAALTVPAAEDALLYLWAVNSHLPDALR